MDRDPKIQSAYTEQEAKDEVIAVARDMVEPGICDIDECECCVETFRDYADLHRALNLVDTYKGVK